MRRPPESDASPEKRPHGPPESTDEPPAIHVRMYLERGTAGGRATERDRERQGERQRETERERESDRERQRETERDREIII